MLSSAFDHREVGIHIHLSAPRIKPYFYYFCVPLFRYLHLNPTRRRNPKSAALLSSMRSTARPVTVCAASMFTDSRSLELRMLQEPFPGFGAKAGLAVDWFPHPLGAFGLILHVGGDILGGK
jgi:hypothetical protein